MCLLRILSEIDGMDWWMYRSYVADCTQLGNVHESPNEWVVLPWQSGIQDNLCAMCSKLIVHCVPSGLTKAVDETADIVLQAGSCHCSEVGISSLSHTGYTELPNKQLHAMFIPPLL